MTHISGSVKTNNNNYIYIYIYIYIYNKLKVLIENLMSQTQRYSYSILHLIEEGLAKSTSQWNAPVTRCCLVSYVVIHIDFACVSRIRLFLAHARGGEAVEEYSNEGLKWVRGDLCVEEASVAPLGLQDSWGTTSISFWHVAVAESGQKMKQYKHIYIYIYI